MPDPVTGTIAVAASLIGSSMSADSVENAANTQANAANNAAGLSADAQRTATEEQKRQFDISQQNYLAGVQRQQPWLDAGTNALSQMRTYAAPEQFTWDKQFKFGPEEFAAGEDPGYQFRIKEGLKALERQQSARGMLGSGAAMKAATRFGQELGSQEYGNAYNRASTEYQNAYNRALTGYNANRGASDVGYNRLASIAGVGQTATQQIQTAGQAQAQLGQNYANNVGKLGMETAANQGNALMTGAQARASAYMQPSVMSNALGTAGQMANIYGMGKKNGLWGGDGNSGNSLSDTALNFAGRSEYGSAGDAFGWG